MSETHNFIYWNCLYDAATVPTDYARELLRVHKPLALIMDEVQPVYAKVFDEMAEEFGMTAAYDRSIRWKGTWMGTYAMIASDSVLKLDQTPLAHALGRIKERRFFDEYDYRSITSAVIRMGNSDVGLVIGRPSHPHHFWRQIRRNLRRPAEWRGIKNEIDQHRRDGLEVIYMGDTNTTFAHTVANKLVLEESGMVLLDHTADGVTKTWGFLWSPKLLHLDRAATTAELARNATLHTLPQAINGTSHTSDHSAIMLSVKQ